TKLGQSMLVGDIYKRLRDYYQEHPPDERDEGALMKRALALEQYGDFLSAHRQLIQAYNSYQQSLEIRDQLLHLEWRRNDLIWQRDRLEDRALSIARQGSILVTQGRYSDALKLYRE